MNRQLSKRVTSGRSYVFALSVFLFGVLLCVGCGGPNAVERSKLIGSWQLDIPGKDGLIFTYNQDQSFIVTTGGRKEHHGFGEHGHWELSGNVLTSSLESAYNEHTVSKPVMMMPNMAKVVISRLNATTMIWSSGLLSGGLTLKRVVTPESMSLTNQP
jgi:hypothetical protein